MLPSVIRFTALSIFLTGTVMLAATEPLPSSPREAPAPKDQPPAGEPILVLPKVQVTQNRLHEIDVEIAKLDKQIAREKKNVKSTEVDKALNNEKITKVAAIFGGNSAEHLSNVAASRVELMEIERSLLEALKLPTTLAEYEATQKELDQLRTTRRNLDKVRP